MLLRYNDTFMGTTIGTLWQVKVNKAYIYHSRVAAIKPYRLYGSNTCERTREQIVAANKSWFQTLPLTSVLTLPKVNDDITNAKTGT